MTDLAALLARVEETTGPDMFLDGELAIALGLFKPVKTQHQRVFSNSWHSKLTNSPVYMAPAFSSSLDAALALCVRVLPECVWSLSSGHRIGGPEGYVGYGCDLAEFIQTPEYPETFGATPALALLAALLKALIAQAELARVESSSVAGLPAHVADATATDAQHSAGKED